jgi:acetyltransferase-like isoleucine patch superfamily enzyme
VLVKKTRIPVKHIVLIGMLPAFLKKAIYRMKGYKIAPGVKLSWGSVIIGKEVSIGKNTRVGFFTIVRATKISLGRYCKIGAMSAIDTESFSMDDDARINEQVYIGGIKTPESALVMGKRTIIMQASYINPTLPITIGDDSGIGGNCLLFTHGSWNSQLEGYPVKFAPITIGKKVWLPWRVFVMPGVTIGDGAVIGADSMINKDIPANALAGGSPAKVLKENLASPLSPDEQKKLMYGFLDEFAAYLQHNSYTVIKEEAEKLLSLSIEGKAGKSHLLFLENANRIPETTTKDAVLILLSATENEIKNAQKTSAMIVSLSAASRIGTSKVGEEVTNFLSRYGIRFNRLD